MLFVYVMPRGYPWRHQTSETITTYKIFLKNIVSKKFPLEHIDRHDGLVIDKDDTLQVLVTIMNWLELMFPVKVLYCNSDWKVMVNLVKVRCKMAHNLEKVRFCTKSSWGNPVEKFQRKSSSGRVPVGEFQRKSSSGRVPEEEFQWKSSRGVTWDTCSTLLMEVSNNQNNLVCMTMTFTPITSFWKSFLSTQWNYHIQYR